MNKTVFERDNPSAVDSARSDFAKFSRPKRRQKPKLSITTVICCYSHEGYFIETAQSVLNQTCPPKIVILNNGANESYTNKIRKFSRENKLKLVEHFPNRYGVAIRHSVIPEIDTDLIAILHDDDVYHPEKISSALDIFTRLSPDYLTTNTDFIDAKGKPWIEQNEAVNAKPFTGNEPRGELLADMIRPPGRVMHYSTLVMPTALAKKNVLGDPFWPRIADGLFWGDLQMNPEIRPHFDVRSMTKVRIHGANDRLYDKFPDDERKRQFYLLAVSEIEYFRRILNNSSDEIITDFLFSFLGISRNLGIVEALVNAAIMMDYRASQLWFAKHAMAPLLVHKAFALDPQKTIEIVGQLTGSDINTFMTRAYLRQADTLFDFCKTTSIVYVDRDNPVLLEQGTPRILTSVALRIAGGLHKITDALFPKNSFGRRTLASLVAARRRARTKRNK